MTETPKADTNWDQRFLALAYEMATWSRDPSTKVGAVAIEPVAQRILSTGYNGFPRGVQDSPERLANRDEKYPRVVHAETNVVANAAATGAALQGATLYVTHPPCPHCAGLIINAGFARVVYDQAHLDGDFSDRWGKLAELGFEMFAEAEIPVEGIHLNERP